MTVIFKHLGNAGRIGNQLWQFASTYGIARTIGDTPMFPNWDYQPFFNVPERFFGGPMVGMEAQNYVPYMDERSKLYLQDYNLFHHWETDVRTYLRPTPYAEERLREATGFWELEHPILSIHVRRGDNIYDPGVPDKYNYHPPRPVSYYRDAIDLAGDYASVVFFSDDIPWCRETFPDLNAYFYEGVARPKEHEKAYATAPVLDWIDLQLMTKCDKHIGSNSSYSWWGAFLSENRTPIFPKTFFGPKINYVDQSLMFPSSWTLIDHEPWRPGVI